MNILMLTPEYEPAIRGGLGRHVTDLSTALAEQGDTVHVITYGIRPDAPAFEKFGLVVVHRTELPLDLNGLSWDLRCANMNNAYLYKALEVCAGTPIDIIHAQDWGVTQAAYGLTHLVSAPLCTTIHLHIEHADKTLAPYYESQVRTLVTRSLRVICCSTFMQTLLVRSYGCQNKLSIIPNGVLLERFPFVSQLGRHVLFVGRLVPRKGAHLAIEAFSQIADGIDGDLLLVGGGAPGYVQELQDLSHQRRVAHRTHFLGYAAHTDLPSYFAQARVTIVPSIDEPFGIVALESMASGIPVIVADSSGLAEIVRHNETGFLACPGESSSFARVIQEVYQDTDRLSLVRHQARIEVEKRYTWQRVATLTRQVYQEILAKPNLLTD